MDIALIENAQHDIDREDRGEDQQRLAGERLLEDPRGAGEHALDRDRDLIAAIVRWIAAVAWPSEMPCGRLNEKVVTTNGP